MSIYNEEQFKLQQNGKNYSINISIEEDQLSLVLILNSNPPKKYSGFFSLNELRISSQIFHHTKTLFEAKEIIKRTVIKKQILISEDEHRAKLTFDTGLGHDSAPFPITLFRDANNDIPINQTGEKDPSDNLKRSKIFNSNGGSISESNNETIYNESNFSNNTILRASIGNNVNNKMLNNNSNKINNSIINGNVQFNNSMKLKIVNKNNGNNININNNNIKRNPSDNINNNTYKKVELGNIGNGNFNGNANKDYLALNNNILYNIYNNMNNDNNINSSFYRNLQDSFAKNGNNGNPVFNNNINLNDINNVNNGNNNTDILRKNIRNIDNNSMHQKYLQQQNMNNLMNQRLVINNNNINNIPNGNYIPYKQTPPQNDPYLNNNFVNNKDFLANKQSFHTAPVQKNITRIPNRDNDILINNNLPIDNNKHKTCLPNNKFNLDDISEQDDEDMDENLEEYYKGEQPYRFKNLIFQGKKKVKGNLEKFKKNQNMGDYVPAGTKFVSYLKFPDTKINTNKSLTSTNISSSIISSSNRIVGIEKNIIKNPGELEEITSRLQRILNKKNIKYKLIYRASTDGDVCSTFHDKCDQYQNTLVLIHASGNKRFGGFTTQTWEGEDVNKKDKNCFIFSIDKMKIYDIKKGQDAINCNQDLGPIFIDQIKLLDKFFTQGGTTNKKGQTFETLEDFEITGGAEKFGVKEVEVYHVK